MVGGSGAGPVVRMIQQCLAVDALIFKKCHDPGVGGHRWSQRLQFQFSGIAKRKLQNGNSVGKMSTGELYENEIEDVFAALKTSSRGLAITEVKDRQIHFGKNSIKRLQKRSIVSAFIANFTHMMALLLWAGGCIALVTGMVQLTIAIWLVNIVNGLFSFWQEFRAEKATEALLKLIPKQSRVVRDGIDSTISAEELVPGDVIILQEGDEIAADARLISDKGLYVDQSLLTGESAPVRKSTYTGDRYHHPNRGQADVLYAGTSVTAGQARAVVIATGMNSRFGQIANLTQSIHTDDSPLQKELARVTKTVTVLVVTIGVLFFLVAVLMLNVNSQDSFIFALGMIVAFVPEGMLPTVSLSLAIAVQQMSARNAVVKRLSSVETLGCTTVICSDKTGTLTKNEMIITDIFSPDCEVTVCGSGYEPTGLFGTKDGVILSEVPAPISYLLEAGGRCCNAKLVEPSDQERRWKVIGDPTEAAIVVALRKAASYSPVENPEVGNADLVDVLAFDPYRKRMSMLWKTNQGFIAFVKGAPRELLDHCVSTRAGGSDCLLEGSTKERIKKKIDGYAERGLRVLAIAQRRFSDKPEIDENSLERNLTFLGLVAMIDPLHEEVPDAMSRCHEAGIRVIMITGDYEMTAATVARQAGISKSDKLTTISGQRLRSLSDNDLKVILRDEVIFARTSPEDKLRIVKVLQQMDHVVAVTGDGVNDAPALKQADIGIAMGNAGTDVARESADVVLSDDNFASIVAAVELGRAVYDNIRKFALYVFTSNVAEAVPFGLLLFSRGLIPLPITLMQVLLIDLGTDMVPAIGLGADPPDLDVMRRPPRDSRERLLNRQLLFKVFFWYGSIEAIAGISAYFFVNWINGWPSVSLAPEGTANYQTATTAAVAAIVVCQIGTVLCCRTTKSSLFSRSLVDNKLLLVGIFVELALLAAVMFVVPLQQIFGTRPLPLPVILFVAVWLPVFILLDEYRKKRLRESKSCSRFSQ